MLDYYNNIDKEKLCDGVTQIVAMDFGKYLFSRNIYIFFLEHKRSYYITKLYNIE